MNAIKLVYRIVYTSSNTCFDYNTPHKALQWVLWIISDRILSLLNYSADQYQVVAYS